MLCIFWGIILLWEKQVFLYAQRTFGVSNQRQCTADGQRNPQRERRAETEILFGSGVAKQTNKKQQQEITKLCCLPPSSAARPAPWSCLAERPGQMLLFSPSTGSSWFTTQHQVPPALLDCFSDTAHTTLFLRLGAVSRLRAAFKGK